MTNTNERTAIISDANSSLLFCIDGKTVWDKNQIMMPNGFGLAWGLSATPSALIVLDAGTIIHCEFFAIF